MGSHLLLCGLSFVLNLVGCGGWSSGARRCWHIQAKPLWLEHPIFWGGRVWDVDDVQQEDVGNADSTQEPSKALPAEPGWQTLWSSSGEPATHPWSMGHPCTGMLFLTFPHLCIPYKAHSNAGKAPPGEGRAFVFGCPSMSPVQQLKL